ncbi:MAG: hypothetical protein GTO16_08440, partial [Candidatus Aminicenantes bacterium]|nr:hypothetical protein [Candidatus Aminicenantes bacterium]
RLWARRQNRGRGHAVLRFCSVAVGRKNEIDEIEQINHPNHPNDLNQKNETDQIP